MYNKVVAVLAEVCCVDEGEITSETTLNDLRLDSLDYMDVIFKLDTDVEVDVTELSGSTTVGQLSAKLEKTC